MTKIKSIAVYTNAFQDLKRRIEDLDHDDAKRVAKDIGWNLSNLLSNDDIFVGDLSDDSCRYSQTGISATLVLEEDNEVHWYANPEPGDLKLIEAPITCNRLRK
ncbi:MAG: hypothetical protein IMZ52_10690 [Actinobacteria bacterium]|nr:hypothetical protein [Bacteroidota bacterium]MBE3095487.1 hypothetical protein [Actinomycetota bacterium]